MEPVKKTLASKAKSFFVECKRVLKVTRKPSNEELKTIVKITALGLVVIGLVGFFISMIGTYVKAL